MSHPGHLPDPFLLLWNNWCMNYNYFTRSDILLKTVFVYFEDDFSSGENREYIFTDFGNNSQ